MKIDERWQRLKEIFNELSDASPDARDSIIARISDEEGTIAREAKAMLDVEQEAGSFLELDAAAFTRSMDGAKLGNFCVTREIGSGGMGSVFEAVRDDGEFDQRVAIKVSNRGLFSTDMVRRLLIERQILARLEHPNIVRLLDGGITNERLPFFVMELVDGVPITDYAARHLLTVRERLELFLQMANAVSYAHRQLVVHRDLKPNNVLVTPDGLVKLLDFGIAKVLDVESNPQTVGTPMTPEYASPEQIRGDTITTASDIYSLGMVLYELLTGQTPCRLYGVDSLELSRAICSVELPRPSYAISDPMGRGRLRTANMAMNDTVPSVDARHLRGDLDNIILMAIRKDPIRRYGSVEQFADDIRAYLDGRTVTAHPQSYRYRTAKFVRRNRVAVSIALASIVLVMSATCIAVYQAVRADRERQIAEINFQQVRKLANIVINDYHDEIAKFDGSTELRAKLVIDGLGYLNSISTDDSDDAQLLKEMAIAYRKIGTVLGMPYMANLGRTEEGIANQEKSVELLERAFKLAPNDLGVRDELVRSYANLAEILGRRNENRPELYEKAVAINEVTIALDPGDIGRRAYGLRLRVLMTDLSTLDDIARSQNYRQIIADGEKLVPLAPRDVTVLGVLAVCNERIANSMRWNGLRHRNENREADAVAAWETSEEFGRRSLEHRLKQIVIEPGLPMHRRNLFVAELNLACVLTFLKRLEEAKSHHQAAKRILDQIKQADPANSESTLDEMALLKNSFEMAIEAGLKDKAFSIASSSAKIAERYFRGHSDNNEALLWTGYFHERLFELHQQANRPREAERLRQMLDALHMESLHRFGKDTPFSGLALG